MCVDDCHKNFTLLDSQQVLNIYLKRYFSNQKEYVSSKFLYLFDITFLIYNMLTIELFSLFTMNADVI